MIKDTKEVILAAGLVGAIVARRLKDGFQMTDIPAIMTDVGSDPATLAALAAAKDGVTNVPAELKTITAIDGLELAEVGIQIVRATLAELRKP